MFEISFCFLLPERELSLIDCLFLFDSISGYQKINAAFELTLPLIQSQQLISGNLNQIKQSN